MDHQTPHNAVSSASVLGEAVHNSTQWVRVEEAHRSTSDPPKHRVVERMLMWRKIAPMMKDVMAEMLTAVTEMIIN